MNGCLPPVSQQQELKKEGERKRKLNHLGIDVGKRICRVALKDDRGKILDEFFFGNNSQGILELIKRTQNYRTKKCNAVLESTGNMWIRIHDTLEDNGIDTKSSAVINVIIPSSKSFIQILLLKLPNHLMKEYQEK